MKTKTILLLGFFGFAAQAFGQAGYNSPETGEKVLGTYFASDIDNVDVKNGNLHISIPLFSLPGRQLPLSLAVDYNSQFLDKHVTYDEQGNPLYPGEFLGWRKTTGISGALTASLNELYSEGTPYSFPYYYNGTSYHWHRVLQHTFWWVDGRGTKYSWVGPQLDQYCNSSNPWGNCAPDENLLADNISVESSTSEFIQLNTGNYFSGQGTNRASLYFKDGTRLILPVSAADSRELQTTNGNRLLASLSTQNVTSWGRALGDVLPLTDTVGRTITYSKVGNTETITIYATDGTAKVYRINYVTITQNSPWAPYTPPTFTVTMVGSIDLPNNKSYTFLYDSNGYLERVTLPSGGYIRYQHNTGSSSGLRYVVDRWVSSDGQTEQNWHYAYNTNSTTITDPTGATETDDFSGDLNSKITRGAQVVEKVWQTGTNARIQTVKTTLNGMVKESTFQYDSYNNVTRQDDYDWGSGARGPLMRYTTREYVASPYTPAHIYGKLHDQIVYNPAGTVIEQTLWDYDTQSLVGRTGTIPGWVDAGIPRGNLTLFRRRLIPAGALLATTTQFDVLGNPVSQTDPGGHTTTTDFTDKFINNLGQAMTGTTTYAFPTRVTDPAGFYADTYYYFNNGLVQRTTDSLNRTTASTYDLMNRTLQITKPNGGWTKYCYNDPTPAATCYDATTISVTKEILVDSANNVGRVKTYVDKLYRVTKTQTADPGGNIFVDNVYDGRGRKWKISNPYRAGDNVVCSPTQTVACTVYQYDALDRPTVTTGIDGSTVQYSYNGNQTTVTDEAGNLRRYTYDGLGRMTKVEEPNPTLDTPLVTTYAYNAVGKLTQTIQGSQTRTFNFDLLGRMTSQVLPESGTTSFTYNDDNLLLTKTDDRGIVTTLTYGTSGYYHDVQSRTYSNATPAVTFVYNVLGLRTSMTDGLGSVVYSYDSLMDRLTQESRVITGVGTFVTAYTSNIKGDMTQMTYPSGRVVKFSYATGGGCCNSRLESVVDQTTNNTTIADSLAYNAAGETTSLRLGNNVVETFGYNARLQHTSIAAALGSTTLMSLAYDYGTSTSNTGRVRSRTDAIQPEHSVNYTYDSIYRLSQATSANNEWSIAWTFDQWGNRLTQTPQGLATSKVGAPSFSYSNNRITSPTTNYDLAGNQLSDGLHNYTFNAENQITQMDGGAAVYGYDGEGRRLKKTVGSETTYFFYGVGGLLCEFTTTNTGATQASSTDRTTYRTSDKLGSAVLIINASGTVIENNRTLPYGEAWLTESTLSMNDKKFTTYQRDSESNLDYAMNRYSQNSMGRFAGVDKGRIILQIPTSLNRYIYTINDPINRIDPDGNEGYTVHVQVWDRFPPSPLGGFGAGVGGNGYGVGDPKEPGSGDPISPALKLSMLMRGPSWTRDWGRPVDFNCVITGRFGEERGDNNHWGTDVSTATFRGGQGFGASIFSMTGGTVYDVRIWDDKAKANWVTIKTSSGAFVTYMHITGAVEVGTTIAAGDLLGMTDDSGSIGASATFGPHVHIFGTWDGKIDSRNTNNRFSVERSILDSGCTYAEK